MIRGDKLIPGIQWRKGEKAFQERWLACHVLSVLLRSGEGELPDVKMIVLHPVATARALRNGREQKRWGARVALTIPALDKALCSEQVRNLLTVI